MKWSWKCHEDGVARDWRGNPSEISGLLKWTGGKDGSEPFPGKLPWDGKRQLGGPNLVKEGHRTAGELGKGGEGPGDFLANSRTEENDGNNVELTRGTQGNNAAAQLK